LSIHLSITRLQDEIDEGSYSFEGRGIVLLVLATIRSSVLKNYSN
jgi:hypothetical protein